MSQKYVIYFKQAVRHKYYVGRSSSKALFEPGDLNEAKRFSSIEEAEKELTKCIENMMYPLTSFNDFMKGRFGVIVSEDELIIMDIIE